MKKLEMRDNLIRNNTGSVLVMAVILSLAIVLLGTACLKFVEYYGLRISNDIYQTRAVHASLAGLKYTYAEYGKKRISSPVSDRIKLCDNTTFLISVVKGGNDSIGFSETSSYIMYSTGEVTNVEFSDPFNYSVGKSSSVLSYADWLYISDRERQSYRPVGYDTLSFWTPDTLDGKVHSNDLINLQKRGLTWPVFYKAVSSCSTRFVWDPADEEPYNYDIVFQGGYKLGYSYFQIPVRADSVRYHGYYYDGQQLGDPTLITELTLQADGFLIRQRPNNNAPASQRNYTGSYDFGEDIRTLADDPHPYPDNKALFIEGEVWVTAAKGGLHYNYSESAHTDSLVLTGFSGKLTIGASGDIIIPQNIMYASSSVSGVIPPGSPDILGLISEKHILIWRQCPQSVRIQAALAAIGSLYVMDNVPTNRCNNGLIPVDGVNGTISVDGINCYDEPNTKYQLIIQGCLIMRERGLVHTHYAPPGQTTYERGFDSKRYYYDNRFINNPPPHFFVSNDGRKLFKVNLDDLFGVF